MDKVTDKGDIRIIDQKINEVCRTEIVRYTCQFFTKNTEGIKPFGSGVFVKSEKKYFILTASHVAGHLKNGNLFIKAYRANIADQAWITKIEKSGKFEKSNEIDMAIIPIDEEMLPSLSRHYSFLPISRLKKHDKLYDTSQYAVVGFPTVNVKRDKGFLETGISIYLASPSKEKVYEHYGFDPKYFYIFEVKGKGKDLVSGNKVKINSEFHGISGCGLWLMLIYEEGGEYKIDYRLIGIMTEVRKAKYYCLIGNKIQIIVDALIKYENINIDFLQYFES